MPRAEWSPSACRRGIAILSANRVRNITDIAISIELAKTIVAVGNVTTGIIQAPGMPTQFAQLNLRA